MMSNQTLILAVSIFASALIVGGALVYSANSQGSSGFASQSTASGERAAANAGETRRIEVPVTEDDHIRGSEDAAITIVEFSDLECPFCKRFHSTMQQALAEYPGQVSWVYKHFPLDSIHSKADKEAEAAECAGELGGEEAFWAYTDKVFEITPSNNGLDLALLPQIAEDLGLDRSAFQSCLESGRYADRVEADYQLGLRSGVSGTPGSFLNGIPIRGAIPYEDDPRGFKGLRSYIEEELQK